MTILAWAALGVQLQKTYIKHYRAINLIFEIVLLCCAWNIVRS